jgi:hypothetical protein
VLSRLFVQVWLFGSSCAPAGIGWFQNEPAAHHNPGHEDPAETGALTTAVAFERAEADPELFVAVTCARTVAPTSPEPREYDLDVAPEIAEHASPVVLQRTHWYA